MSNGNGVTNSISNAMDTVGEKAAEVVATVKKKTAPARKMAGDQSSRGH